MMENYAYWNDTSVAHVFIKLITKTNHPYNDNPITNEDFQQTYDLLKGYIEWHKTNYKKSSPLYNFTQNNILDIFNRLDYKIDNKQELLDIWKNKIIVKIVN